MMNATYRKTSNTSLVSYSSRVPDTSQGSNSDVLIEAGFSIQAGGLSQMQFYGIQPAMRNQQYITTEGKRSSLFHTQRITQYRYTESIVLQSQPHCCDCSKISALFENNLCVL